MEPETIREDVEATSTPDPQDLSPEEAFKRNLRGDDKSTPTTAEPNAEADPQEGNDESEGSGTEDVQTPEEPVQRRAAADDDEVVIKVGEEEHKVSVKDLKRLFGQEQSLTKKSVETSNLQKQVQEEATRYRAGLEKITEVAKARWAEYEKIDFLAIKDTMSPEQFAQLRQDATKAYQEHKFFSEELEGIVEKQQHEHIVQARENARTCLATITRAPTDDAPNPTYIEGWNDTVYNDVRSFALSIGGDPRVIDTIVDPTAIKVLHMAMQFQRMQERAKTLKPKPTVPVTPKKVPAQVERPTDTDDASEQVRKTAQRLRATGSIDDATSAFAARLRNPR